MVMDVLEFVDSNLVDILLTDVKAENLLKACGEAGKKCYISTRRVLIPSASGGVFGRHNRLGIALPVTARNKTMYVPFLLDTTCPYTFLSRDVFTKFGLEITTDDFNGEVNGVRLYISVSPPSSHFKDFCILGSDYLARSCSKLTCSYYSRQFLLELNVKE
jgi:hypothetical protein